jgi:hypothetical protein
MDIKKSTYLFILIVLLFGCGKSGVNEGVIKYDITYNAEEKKTNSVIDLLPTEMEQSFKDGSSKCKIEGFMGMFLTALISNSKTKTNSYLFKLLADKNYCQTKIGQPTLGFDPMPGMHLKKTLQKKEIAGIKAKKIVVSFDDPKIPSFDIYYTDEIEIDNPNWSNPYTEIPSVLLEFRVKMKGITMIIKAKEVLNKEIANTEFDIPDGFKKVTPKNLDAIIIKIMNSAK